MDPAMLHDWTAVVGERASFNKRDAFLAARAYLQNWYAIGPLEEIKRVIDAMALGRGDEPLDPDVSRDWNLSWETVSHNVAAGNPFKTALLRMVGANGKPGHLEWLVDGGLAFVEDRITE